MTLDQLAADINGRVEALYRGLFTARERAKQMRLSIAQQMVEARNRVAAGEAGDGTTWREWHTANVINMKTKKPLAIRSINRYLAIGGADDPKEELERVNEVDRIEKATARKETENVLPAQSEVATVFEGPSIRLAHFISDWHELSAADQAAFRKFIGV